MAALDVPASEQQNSKHWQKSVTDGQRRHFITLLMERSRAGRFITVNPDVFNSALEYTREQESNIFDMANTRSEYYHLLAELMWKTKLREQEMRVIRREVLQIRDSMERMMQATLGLENGDV